jgi:acetyl esterase/lipase
MTRFILTALILVSLAGCASHEGRPEPTTPSAKPTHVGTIVIKDVVYSPADWPQRLAADLYIPEGEGPFPAVLMIHGGGWSGRSRDDMTKISQEVAQRGYVVMNASYRLAPKYRFPAQYHDVAHAVLWLRAHAEANKVKSDRIAAWGYSAGAHLAALVGTTGPGDKQYVEGSRVQAVVAGGTPVDVRYYKGGRLTNGLMGIPYDKNPDLWRDASPIALITPDDPPVFLYHGNVDFHVPVNNAYAMYNTLKEAEIPAELYLLRGREHLSTFVTESPVMEGINFLDRYLRDGDQRQATQMSSSGL